MVFTFVNVLICFFVDDENDYHCESTLLHPSATFSLLCLFFFILSMLLLQLFSSIMKPLALLHVHRFLFSTFLLFVHQEEKEKILRFFSLLFLILYRHVL